MKIPHDISLMPTPLAINALTNTQIKVRLPSDEEEGDQTQGEPMDIEIEAEGQPSSSQSRGKGSQTSSSSVVPSDAFQIILERIDGLQNVQNEQSNRLTTIQEKLNLLSAKFDSFTTK